MRNRLAAAGAAALCFSLAAALPANADSGCGVGVLFAQLVAVGKTHHDGEYVVQAAPLGNALGEATTRLSLRLAAESASSGSTILTADGATVGLPRLTGKTSALLVILPTSDIRSFSVVSAGANGAERPCSPIAPYDIEVQADAESTTFDDTASWAKVGTVYPVDLDGPTWTYRGTPDATAFDSTFSDEADVGTTLIIGADGKLKDATVVRSSGQLRADAASIEAARESRFKPAHLPAAFGATAVAVETVVTYTFTAP